MKVLEKDLERRTFEVEVEDKEDLWHLYNIIDIGDTVCGQTFREVRVSRADGSEERVGRRKIYICIEVEDLYLQSFTESLRIRGKVVSGPEDVHVQGQYHTFSVKERDKIKISKKEWLSFHEERLKVAQKKERPKVILVTIDDQEADIFLVREYSMEYLFDIQSHISGKYLETGGRSAEKLRYLSKVAEEVGRLAEKEKAFVIVGGPGFTKSELVLLIKDKFKQINVMEESASSIGPSGAREILRRGALNKILQSSTLIRDSELVDELFFRLSNKPSLVTYGIEEVKNAVERGAVDSLLVSGRLLKNVSPEERSKIEELCKKTEDYGGKVYFIGAEHEKGLQFFNLGGIAALLRFSVS
jgi:protein pelota